MPRKRKSINKGLPTRWGILHKAYYYYVPTGMEPFWDNKKLFRLGGTLAEAYSTWSERLNLLEFPEHISRIGELLDRYLVEVVPHKAPASQQANQQQINTLRGVFGDMPLKPFPPKLIYQYVARRSVKRRDPKDGIMRGGRVAAHREVEVLSHAYTKAVEWGYIDRHPFKNEIRLTGEKPRTRYVEDWEILACLALDTKRKKGSVLLVQAYLRLKLLTGMAQGDLLRLTEEHLKPDGIHNQRHKTKESSGKRTIYAWSTELRTTIQAIRDARPNHPTSYLFCTRQGKPYINERTGKAPGWKSMWQRFLARVIEETDVVEHFTEHDLRAKVSSDADSLEHARALLAHADSKTTERVYRRKPEVVTPVKGRY